MIDLDREEFEKLPEISKRLQHGDVFFNGTCYKSKNSSYRRATFINGAWYAFQEQQKKLDCCREENEAHLEKIDELQARVDEALHAADESCGVSVAAFVKLNRILKGNKDED